MAEQSTISGVAYYIHVAGCFNKHHAVSAAQEPKTSHAHILLLTMSTFVQRLAFCPCGFYHALQDSTLSSGVNKPREVSEPYLSCPRRMPMRVFISPFIDSTLVPGRILQKIWLVPLIRRGPPEEYFTDAFHMRRCEREVLLLTS